MHCFTSGRIQLVSSIAVAGILIAACSNTGYSQQASKDAAPSALPTPQKPDESFVTAIACSGRPFGVGKLEFVFAKKDALSWSPDQPLILSSLNRRAFYPVWAIANRSTDPQAAGRLQQVTVFFLFREDGPLQLTAGTPDQRLTSDRQLKPINDQQQHARLLTEWWQAYQQQRKQSTGHQRIVHNYLLNMLSRRLELPLADTGNDDVLGESPMAKLEEQFERIVGTLFGFDSVLLAMPHKAPRTKRGVRANQALPPAVSIRSVPLPSFRPTMDVERLAFRVPKDCFYVRCRRVANYQWLRDFMLQWGGSLNEIVATGATNNDARALIEHQLALSAAELKLQQADVAIDDMAVIGSDLLFPDGAGIGVLFQASDGKRLGEIIRQQRKAVIQAQPTVNERKIQIEGLMAHLLRADDNSVRSYYLVDEDFHLITNSRDIATKFVKTRDKAVSLGGLREFGFARSKEPLSRNAHIWIYLSDPFFRRIISPAYRIEMGRRARALADLRELRLAMLAAANEGSNKPSIQSLRDRAFLSPDFGWRADDSQPLIRNSAPIDSIRGKPGSFVPIPDMEISKATAAEKRAYETFRQAYTRQWRIMDPVVVSIGTEAANQTGRQRVSTRILVTPYARQRYQHLVTALAPPTARHVRPLPNELLSLSATLRDGSGSRRAHIGLLDDVVPFEIRHGEIIRKGDFAAKTLAERNFVAAVNPRGTRGLQLMQRLHQSLEGNPVAAQPIRQPPPVGMNFARLLLWGTRPRSMLLSGGLQGNPPAPRPRVVEPADDWTLLADNADMRRRMLQSLSLEEIEHPAQVQFSMADVSQAQAAPYIHAYAYLSARKSSANNAGMFELVRQQFNIPAPQAQQAAENLLQTRFTCPLGGKYKVVADAPVPHWRSTAWSTQSYFKLTEAPSDYQLPFLRWLHGLDVRFNLTSTTLTADISLLVHTAGDLPPVLPESEHTKGSHDYNNTVGLVRVANRGALNRGATVAILSSSAPLMHGPRTLAQLKRGERVMVLEVRANWVGIQRQLGDRIQTGWVDRQHVGR